MVAAALMRRVHQHEDDADGVLQMLIARRTAPESVAGLWEFPGGKLEPGESLREGVRRELQEELGVEVELGAEVTGPGSAGYAAETGWRLTERHTMRLFAGVIAEGEPFPLEDHDRLDWVPLGAELLDYPWIPADRPIVEQLISDYGAEPACSCLLTGDACGSSEEGLRRRRASHRALLLEHVF